MVAVTPGPPAGRVPYRGREELEVEVKPFTPATDFVCCPTSLPGRCLGTHPEGASVCPRAARTPDSEERTPLTGSFLGVPRRQEIHVCGVDGTLFSVSRDTLVVSREDRGGGTGEGAVVEGTRGGRGRRGRGGVDGGRRDGGGEVGWTGRGRARNQRYAGRGDDRRGRRPGQSRYPL